MSAPVPEMLLSTGAGLFPLKTSVALFTTLPVPMRPVPVPLPICRVPLLMVTNPDCVFSPLQIMVPGPALIRAPLPEITPRNSVFVLLMVKVLLEVPAFTFPVKSKSPVVTDPKVALLRRSTALEIVREVTSEERIAPEMLPFTPSPISRVPLPSALLLPREIAPA